MSVSRKDMPEVGIIRVFLERSPTGLFFATSEDLAGLFVAHRDPEQIRADIPNIIRLLYRRRFNLEVLVVKASHPDGQPEPESLGAWAAIPPHIAREALSQ